MAETKIGKIVEVLDDLLKEEDVLATMVSTKSGQNVSPPPERFKVKQIAIWSMISASVNDAFSLMWKFQNFGIDKIYLELGEHEVVFFVIDSNTILVCVLSELSNKGILEVEMENSRLKIKEILGGR